MPLVDRRERRRVMNYSSGLSSGSAVERSSKKEDAFGEEAGRNADR
jgi:hypothetical protein